MMNAQRFRSIDGVQGGTSRPTARQTTVQHRPIAQPASRSTAAAPTPAAPTRIAFDPPGVAFEARESRWQRFQLPLILLIGTVGGLLAQTAWFGIAAIIVYGIASFIFHIPSRTTFSLAALSFVTVSILLLVKPDMVLASTFTTYAFLFLGIGVIALIIEARPQERRRKRRRGR